MKVPELFRHINGAFRGSDDDAPSSGTTDYALWIDTANRKINEYARDNKKTRQSMWAKNDITTVIAVGTQSYTLTEELLAPSDIVEVVSVDGNTTDFTIVKPEERLSCGSGCCYIVGSTVTFIDEFKTGDQLIGGTIYVAGYYMPTALVDDTSDVEVDDPFWLVYATAAELAFNDLTYSDKSPDLTAKSIRLYRTMSNNNQRGTYGNPRKFAVKVKNIGVQ